MSNVCPRRGTVCAAGDFPGPHARLGRGPPVTISRGPSISRCPQVEKGRHASVGGAPLGRGARAIRAYSRLKTAVRGMPGSGSVPDLNSIEARGCCSAVSG